MQKMIFAALIAIIMLAGTAGVAGADLSQASVRFVHTVPGEPAVDIAVVGGPVLVSDLAYPNASPYLSVAPGIYNIELRATGTSTVLVRILGWHAFAGVTTTVRLVMGGDGHLVVAPMTDLARTGAGSYRMVLLGLGLMVAGLVMFLYSSRAAAWRRVTVSPHVSAQNAQDSGSITCSIEEDGKFIATETSSGALS